MIPSYSTASHSLISYITLASNDIQTEVKFYRSVLLLPEPKWHRTDFASWKTNQLHLAILSQDAFCKETGLLPPYELGVAGSAKAYRQACLLSHNVNSEKLVVDALARAKESRAEKTIEATHTSWGGFRGFFVSPSGQLWEICYNPNATQ